MYHEMIISSQRPVSCLFQAQTSNGAVYDIVQLHYNVCTCTALSHMLSAMT